MTPIWVCLNPDCVIGAADPPELVGPYTACPGCSRPLLPKRDTAITEEEKEKWGFPV